MGSKGTGEMRIERIEETTEANRVAAASAVRNRGRDALDAAPDRRVARLLPALARLFSDSAASPRAALLAQTSELLGTALGADHVALYLAEPLLAAGLAPSSDPRAIRFVQAAAYSRRGRTAASAMTRDAARDAAPDVSDSITLSPDEEVGRRLLEGRSARVFRSLPRSGRVLASGLTGAPGWSRIHTTLQVPCPGPEGPLALIALEGPFSDPRASQALSESIEAAARLLGSHLERDRLARELAAIRVEQAGSERLAALGRIASSAAHDLNNVLTAIVGYADLLELELPGGVEGAPGTSGRLELDEIRSAAERGAKLVEQVLRFGRKQPVIAEEAQQAQGVDVAQVLTRLESMLRRVAGTKVELEMAIAAGLPSVHMERERFERILVNLVANARHAIEACPGRAGRIEIALDRARAKGNPAGDESIRLRVRDNGCGMDANVKRRIFEPFFTTRSAGGGTGLGLADVADFAHRAGATVEVESAPGAGCELVLRFPSASTPSPLPSGRPEARSAAVISASTAPNPL